MTRAEVDEYADACGLELLVADGFDDCILGIARQFNKTFVVYDQAKVVAVLITRDGMSPDDADEWFEFNIVDGWLGDSTPAYLITSLGE